MRVCARCKTKINWNKDFCPLCAGPVINVPDKKTPEKGLSQKNSINASQAAGVLSNEISHKNSSTNMTIKSEFLDTFPDAAVEKTLLKPATAPSPSPERVDVTIKSTKNPMQLLEPATEDLGEGAIDKANSSLLSSVTEPISDTEHAIELHQQGSFKSAQAIPNEPDEAHVFELSKKGQFNATIARDAAIQQTTHQPVMSRPQIQSEIQKQFPASVPEPHTPSEGTTTTNDSKESTLDVLDINNSQQDTNTRKSLIPHQSIQSEFLQQFPEAALEDSVLWTDPDQEAVDEPVIMLQETQTLPLAQAQCAVGTEYTLFSQRQPIQAEAVPHGNNDAVDTDQTEEIGKIEFNRNTQLVQENAQPHFEPVQSEFLKQFPDAAENENALFINNSANTQYTATDQAGNAPLENNTENTQLVQENAQLHFKPVQSEFLKQFPDTADDGSALFANNSAKAQNTADAHTSEVEHTDNENTQKVQVNAQLHFEPVQSEFLKQFPDAAENENALFINNSANTQYTATDQAGNAPLENNTENTQLVQENAQLHFKPVQSEFLKQFPDTADDGSALFANNSAKAQNTADAHTSEVEHTDNENTQKVQVNAQLHFEPVQSEFLKQFPDAAENENALFINNSANTQYTATDQAGSAPLENNTENTQLVQENARLHFKPVQSEFLKQFPDTADDGSALFANNSAKAQNTADAHTSEVEHTDNENTQKVQVNAQLHFEPVQSEFLKQFPDAAENENALFINNSANTQYTATDQAGSAPLENNTENTQLVQENARLHFKPVQSEFLKQFPDTADDGSALFANNSAKAQNTADAHTSEVEHTDNENTQKVQVNAQLHFKPVQSEFLKQFPDTADDGSALFANNSANTQNAVDAHTSEAKHADNENTQKIQESTQLHFKPVQSEFLKQFPDTADDGSALFANNSAKAQNTADAAENENALFINNSANTQYTATDQAGSAPLENNTENTQLVQENAQLHFKPVQSEFLKQFPDTADDGSALFANNSARSSGTNKKEITPDTNAQIVVSEPVKPYTKEKGPVYIDIPRPAKREKHQFSATPNNRESKSILNSNESSNQSRYVKSLLASQDKKISEPSISSEKPNYSVTPTTSCVEPIQVPQQAMTQEYESAIKLSVPEIHVAPVEPAAFNEHQQLPIQEYEPTINISVPKVSVTSVEPLAFNLSQQVAAQEHEPTINISVPKVSVTPVEPLDFNLSQQVAAQEHEPTINISVPKVSVTPVEPLDFNLPQQVAAQDHEPTINISVPEIPIMPVEPTAFNEHQQLPIQEYEPAINISVSKVSATSVEPLAFNLSQQAPAQDHEPTINISVPKVSVTSVEPLAFNLSQQVAAQEHEPTINISVPKVSVTPVEPLDFNLPQQVAAQDHEPTINIGVPEVSVTPIEPHAFNLPQQIAAQDHEPTINISVPEVSVTPVEPLAFNLPQQVTAQEHEPTINISVPKVSVTPVEPLDFNLPQQVPAQEHHEPTINISVPEVSVTPVESLGFNLPQQIPATVNENTKNNTDHDMDNISDQFVVSSEFLKQFPETSVETTINAHCKQHPTGHINDLQSTKKLENSDVSLDGEFPKQLPLVGSSSSVVTKEKSNAKIITETKESVVVENNNTFTLPFQKPDGTKKDVQLTVASPVSPLAKSTGEMQETVVQLDYFPVNLHCLLEIFTLGIFPYLWFANRWKTFNLFSHDEEINSRLAHTYIGTGILTQLFIVLTFALSFLMPSSVLASALSKLPQGLAAWLTWLLTPGTLGVIYAALFFAVILPLRTLIYFNISWNICVVASEWDPEDRMAPRTLCSWLGLFTGGTAYFQYHINRLIALGMLTTDYEDDEWDAFDDPISFAKSFISASDDLEEDDFEL